MSYNTGTGVYTPAAGATTATAGQTIASATWNAIHSDLSTALTTLGEAMIPVLSSIGIRNTYYSTAPVVVNFAASSSDAATFTIALPTGITTYRLESMRVYGAGGNLNSVVVSLYTAASGGGTAVIGSTTLTVNTSLPNTNNSAQLINPSLGNIMWNAGQLFLHITSSTATSNTATVSLRYEPGF